MSDRERDSLRETIFLINSIRRRIQLTNDIINRTVSIQSFADNLVDEININIQLSNNVMNTINSFVELFGGQLLNNTDYEDFVNLPTQKVTLKDTELEEKLEPVTTEIECGICKDKTDKDVVKIKQCKHEFCKECIREWLTKYNVNCPMCRKDVRE